MLGMVRNQNRQLNFDDQIILADVEGYESLTTRMLADNCNVLCMVGGQRGRLLNADPSNVSFKVTKRALLRLGTLEAGNYYAEMKVVVETLDKWNASKVDIEEKALVALLTHSESRDFGHQAAIDALISVQIDLKEKLNIFS
uniref:3'-phosphate/5'-hydroxy nucleic acid ligase n=1 Tax=Glossina palpalis gambiensis TaxID=67801 RepID=A0A1B0APZ8_9MUSC